MWKRRFKTATAWRPYVVLQRRREVYARILCEDADLTETIDLWLEKANAYLAKNEKPAAQPQKPETKEDKPKKESKNDETRPEPKKEPEKPKTEPKSAEKPQTAPKSE